jgi:pimeloyl-ACP methyl ester carboxylesterase
MLNATTSPTLFADSKGRQLAYRSLGHGTPLILCVRFRGILDDWDPAFLDGLAQCFRVIIFDYSGLGQSTGTASYRPRDLAQDALDLADALDLPHFALGGWSLGGQAAQVLACIAPDRVSHLILIGTTPPGKVTHGPEAVFFAHALKPVNDLADEIVLFFEPASERSRAAALASHQRIAARSSGRSPRIAEGMFLRLLQENKREDMFEDDGGYREFLAGTAIPILVISGDHEIVFPVQNWFALAREWGSLHLWVQPQSGHAPQHQEPEICADLITSFVRHQSGLPR